MRRGLCVFKSGGPQALSFLARFLELILGLTVVQVVVDVVVVNRLQKREEAGSDDVARDGQSFSLTS